MSSETGSSRSPPRRGAHDEARETIELAVIAWACCLAIVAAVAIPLLGLAEAALVAAGSLLGLAAVCLAIAGVQPQWRRR